MTYSYKLNCGQYVLHEDDKPIGSVMDEVVVGFGKESLTMYKHGSVESVTQWLTKSQAKYRQAGMDDMAADLMMISGRFDLDELNQCLINSNHFEHLFAKIMAEMKALPYDYGDAPTL